MFSRQSTSAFRTRTRWQRTWASGSARGLSVLGLAIALMLGVVGCDRREHDTNDGPSHGGHKARPAPEIHAETWLNLPVEFTQSAGPKSPTFSLAQLRGKVVVVEFWATWCPPCRESIPHLNELSSKYASQQVTFIGLTDEPAETVEPFVKKMKMAYVVGVGSQTAGAYGVHGIPSAFVVDRAGRIVWSGHPMDAGFTKAIDDALAVSAAAADDHMVSPFTESEISNAA